MSDLHKKMLGMMPGMPPKAPLPKRGLGDSEKKGPRGKKDFSLIPWTNYFDKYEDVIIDPDTRFRVYVKGNEGPAFFFLHGGGFSGLSWSLLSCSLINKIKCQCYSMDIRGHG